MVAILNSNKSGDPWSGVFNTLSGWTSAVGGNGAQASHSIQYKVADSGDVSASNFTFTSTGTANNIGVILRVTGQNPSQQLGTTDAELDTAANSNVFSGTISSYTPGADGALIVMAVAGWTSAASLFSMSSYSCHGISFTEAYDTAGSGADGIVVGAAYGIQSTASALTAYGATYSGTLNDHYANLAVFIPPIDATGSNTLVTTTTTTFSQSGIADTATSNTPVTATGASFTQTGRGESPTIWNNPAKPSTTWTNPDK